MHLSKRLQNGTFTLKDIKKYSNKLENKYAWKLIRDYIQNYEIDKIKNINNKSQADLTITSKYFNKYYLGLVNVLLVCGVVVFVRKKSN